MALEQVEKRADALLESFDQRFVFRAFTCAAGEACVNVLEPRDELEQHQLASRLHGHLPLLAGGATPLCRSWVAGTQLARSHPLSRGIARPSRTFTDAKGKGRISS